MTSEPAPAMDHIFTRPVQGEAEQQLHVAGTVGLDRGPLLRRALNVGAALVIFIVMAPVMVVIAILIKFTSKGPVLYTQTRVGLDKRNSPARENDPRRRNDLGGRPFHIYKFRTMRVDAEATTGAVWASKEDPRVTPFGRLLRQHRLDELPQLINVLRGEMNLVGPRPERPVIVARLRETVPEYQGRHRILPGITGHAQVNLQYDNSLDDVRNKVGHDIEYIRRASAWEDFKIMAKTIPVILFRRGSR